MSLRHPVLLAIMVFLVTAALGLLLRPLAPIDETRYLAVAWEMHHGGNWFVPSKNFATYSDKPPFLFWAINLVWLITGVSEFAARLVGPLFVCIAIWLTSRLAVRLWPEDPGIAGRAALALAGLMVFALSGSLTMFDVPLTVAVLAGMLALAMAGPQGRGAWVVLGAALGFGVLIKGPVILFHLLPAAALLPVWSGNAITWRQLPARLGLSVLVAVALVTLWLVPAVIIGGQDYRDAILWHQSAGRLAESFAHARPWWWYLSILPVLIFPACFSFALWREGLRASWLQDRGLRLCLIWAGAAILLFSLTSGKQVHYLVPELPAAALIVAGLSRRVPRFDLYPALLVVGLLAIAAMIAGFLPLSSTLGELLQPQTALPAWGLLALAVCGLAARLRGTLGATVLSVGLLLATNLLIGITQIAQIYDSAGIAAVLGPHDGDGLGFTGAPYHAEFNFAARLTAPVTELRDEAAIQAFVTRHPHGVITGRTDSFSPSWPPRETILFRNRDYGIWSSEDAFSERKP